MTAPSSWSRYCQYLIADRQLGFSLDISRVRFSESDLSSLVPRVTTALGAMQELERGAIANLDENRMVGHYWLRAPELAPTQEIAAEIRGTQGNIAEFAKQIHDGVIQGADRRQY